MSPRNNDKIQRVILLFLCFDLDCFNVFSSSLLPWGILLQSKCTAESTYFHYLDMYLLDTYTTTYMHIWRGASFKNKWLRIEAKKNNSNVLKGEIPWRNDKGTIKSTWNISLIYSFSKRRAHCTSQSKKMHFEKILSGNCQAYAPF